MRNRSLMGSAGRTRYLVMLTVALIFAPLALSPASAAQEDAEDGWFAWLGCWQLENSRVNDSASTPSGEQLVCLSPSASDSGTQHTSLSNGEVVLQQELVADGVRRPVEEAGCSGWERGIWSADQQRLYLQSEQSCEGGAQRSVSGVSLLSDSQTWIDISVADVAGQRELVVRRYRSTPEIPAVLQQADNLARYRNAVASSRLGASAALDADDVVEAVDLVDPAVVEAMLVESRATFAVDSRLLIRLDDAGVPPGIIDLMVALSFPDYFVVNEDPAAPQPAATARPVIYGNGGAWFAPFGYGYYSYPGYYPVTIGVPGRPHFGGRVVSGRGYTQVKQRADAPSPFGWLRSGGKGSGGKSSGGSISKSGSSKGSKAGSKASGRTAKRRGGSR